MTSHENLQFIADLSIPLRFNGPQPNAFGVAEAVSRPCQAGALVGDTRLGGSCNFEQVTLIPHCNGTHTECVGHITDERISIRDCLLDVLISAVVVTVTPVEARFARDTYVVDLDDDDLLITRDSLESGIGGVRRDAIIIRTLPNDAAKLARVYSASNTPFLSTEATRLIVEYGFRHLIVDIPSIDRMSDAGNLSNHHLFWNVKPGSRRIHMDSRISSTITELAYVPSGVADGRYVLNLQIAPFAADASPSRPILLRAEPTVESTII